MELKWKKASHLRVSNSGIFTKTIAFEAAIQMNEKFGFFFQRYLWRQSILTWECCFIEFW